MDFISWKEINAGAGIHLLNYDDHSDRECAEFIWEILKKYGYTSYSNELEKSRVLVHSIALIEFVNDCTSLIRDDSFDMDVLEWASETEINLFRIAQLMETNFDAQNELEPEELLGNALAELVETSRKIIIECLEEEYPDSIKLRYKIGGFYTKPSEFDMELSDEQLDNITVSGNVLRYFQWMDEGMPRR